MTKTDFFDRLACIIYQSPYIKKDKMLPAAKIKSFILKLQKPLQYTVLFLPILILSFVLLDEGMFVVLKCFRDFNDFNMADGILLFIFITSIISIPLFYRYRVVLSNYLFSAGNLKWLCLIQFALLFLFSNDLLSNGYYSTLLKQSFTYIAYSTVCLLYTYHLFYSPKHRQQIVNSFRFIFSLRQFAIMTSFIFSLFVYAFLLIFVDVINIKSFIASLPPGFDVNLSIISSTLWYWNIAICLCIIVLVYILEVLYSVFRIHHFITLILILPGLIYFAYLLTSGTGISHSILRWPLFASVILVPSISVYFLARQNKAIIEWLYVHQKLHLLSIFLVSIFAAVLMHINANNYKGLYEYIHFTISFVVVLIPSANLAIFLFPKAEKILTILHYKHTLLPGFVSVLTFFCMFTVLSITVGLPFSHPKTMLNVTIPPVEKMALIENSLLMKHIYTLYLLGEEFKTFDKREQGNWEEMYNGNEKAPSFKQASSQFLTVSDHSPSNLPPRIIIVAIDAMRYDTLVDDILPHSKAPNIARVMEQSLFFTRAYSDYPCTTTALSSLFTSVHPYPLKYSYTQLKTLPEILIEQNIPTLLKVPTHLLLYSFRQLWLFAEPIFKPSHLDPVDTGEMLNFLKKQAEQPKNKPFFSYLHLTSPHRPFNTFNNGKPCTLEEKECYIEEISYADRYLGNVLDFYIESGLEDNTHFFVISDHGEGLGEYGYRDHCITSREFMSQIPIFWMLPKAQREKRQIDVPINLLDLGLTFADLMKINLPQPTHGRSLIPLVENRSIKEKPLVLDSNTDFAVVYQQDHYVWNKKTNSEELFSRIAPSDSKARLQPWNDKTQKRMDYLRSYLMGWLAAQKIYAKEIAQK